MHAPSAITNDTEGRPAMRRSKSMTPLWIISLFVSLTEVVTTLALTKATDGIQVALTAFAIAFPLSVASAFFFILWHRPYVFYPPTEYGDATDVATYVGAFRAATSPEPRPPAHTASAIEAAIVAHAPEPESAPRAAAVESEESWFDLFQRKEYDRAVAALYKQATNDKADRRNIELLVGHILLQKKRSEGVAHFERLIREEPVDARPYDGLASAHIRWGDAASALQILDGALAAGVTPTQLMDVRARTLKKLGRIDDAVAYLESLAAAAPDAAAPFVAIANILQDTPREQEREAVLWRAIQRDANHRDGLSQLASIASNDGRHDQALALYLRLVKLDEKNATFLTLLGNEYLSLGLNGKALAAYERANELASGSEAWILANIANILKNRGFFPAAVRYLRQAVAIDNSSLYAQERLAEALKGSADEDQKESEVLRALETGVKRLPGS